MWFFCMVFSMYRGAGDGEESGNLYLPAIFHSSGLQKNLTFLLKVFRTNDKIVSALLPAKFEIFVRC